MRRNLALMLCIALMSCGAAAPAPSRQTLHQVAKQKRIDGARALEACDDGTGPCTPAMYDRLCSRGENWACSSTADEQLKRQESEH
jgi:hypothetical protein